MSDAKQDLLLYLKLDTAADGKTPDSSGHERAGALTGDATLIEDDAFGACLSVAGKGHVEVPDDDSKRLRRADKVTVTAWARATQRSDGHRRIVGKGEGNGRNYVLWLNNGTDWMFQWNRYAAGFVVAKPPVHLNTWYHLAGCFLKDGDATILIHDCDGRLIEKQTTKFNAYCGDTDEPVTVGTGFTGCIAHVRVYAASLSQEEIERDIAADLEVGRRLRIATLLRATSPQAALRFGTAMDAIVAAESELPLMRPLLSEGFTLEAFVKSGETGPVGVRPRRVIAAFGGADGWELSLEGGVPVFRIAVTEAVTESLAPVRHTVVRTVQAEGDWGQVWETSPNQWHHIVLVATPGRDARPFEYAVFVDGRVAGFLIGGVDDQSATSDFGAFSIGARPASFAGDRAPFVGEISEIRFWDRVLDPREIALNGVRRLSGGEYGLRHYWPLDHVDHGLTKDRTEAGATLQLGGAGPALVPAADVDPALGPRLRLIDATTVINARAEAARLRAEVAQWRREQDGVDARAEELEHTITAINHEREAREEAAVQAETEARAAIAAFTTQLATLRTTLEENRRTLQNRLAQRQWGLGEVIEAVDEQLREARANAVSTEGYRLDLLSLDLKALPLNGGKVLKFPERKELASLPPGALSTVRIDLESRENFEASQRREAEVPDVVGMTESMARRRLAAAGFLMAVAHSVVPDDPRRPGFADRLVGTVRDQTPAAAQRLAINERVTVYLGLRARAS